jgi:alkanesulfonate monooxygenase
VRAAYRVIEGSDLRRKETEKETKFVQDSDSVSIRATYEHEAEWLTSYLWTGAVRHIGGPGIALVGSPEEVASAIMEYRAIGITQFIFSGWPKLDEMLYFGKEVLPLVRRKEQESEKATLLSRGAP